MSYVKTQWVNNTTPINDTNLNKIEQGIYDNSLVVDAVTNTLNPTDTETYKTAELTEGQITDVIGVSDILIKGQTSQNGEPTPSSPVDVNVVSGSNVVNTSNKNLLSLPNGTYSYNNVTAIVNKGIITINGTPSSTPTLLRITLSQPIKLKQNDSVKINVNNLNGIGTSSNYVAFRLVGIVNGVSNDNITDILCTNANANKTFTATNDTIINQVVIRGNTNVTFNNFIIKPQIELGTTTTTYELHQGKEFPLDLPVENLCPQDSITTSESGYTNYSNNGTFGYVESGKTYTLSLIINSSNTTTGLMQVQCFTEQTGGTNQGTVVTFNRINGGGKITQTFTSQYTGYLAFNGSNMLPNNKVFSEIQLEQGSKANAYTPYGTDPIELCKTGDYQDYFYKSGSKWYLHKEIGKITLNGSESGGWTLRETNTNTIRITADGLVSPGILTYSQVYSKVFKGYSSNADMSNIDIPSIAPRDTGSGFTVRFPVSIATTVDGFKTWLASNLPFVYYATSNVTNTEITDTTLISQLEAIYNSPLYEETNVTQENNDLPMVLDITACKDNINGIKAFIRK